MKYNIDDWLIYKDMMVRIAAEYYRKYPMTDIDDLQQEMYLWFITHPKKYKEWEALDQKDRDKLVAKSLRNQCLKYAEREKAKSEGYSLSDLYYYHSSVVEVFLPNIIIESYEMPAKIKDLNGRFNGKGEVNDGMNWLALRSDIARAYYKLPDHKQRILQTRYSQEYPDWSKVAELLQTSPDGARMKVQRAMASLVQNLGGRKPYYDPDTGEEKATDPIDTEEGAEFFEE